MYKIPFPRGVRAIGGLFVVKMQPGCEVTLQRGTSSTLRGGYLEQSRELRSSGESGNLPLDGSALRLQLCALIGAAELLRQAEARKMAHFDETLSKADSRESVSQRSRSRGT